MLGPPGENVRTYIFIFEEIVKASRHVVARSSAEIKAEVERIDKTLHSNLQSIRLKLELVVADIVITSLLKFREGESKLDAL